MVKIMSKGVSSYVIFIIAAIGMFVGAMLMVFYNYIDLQRKEATREACLAKLQNYCFRWVTDKKEPGDWESVHPKTGCEEFGIKKPEKEYCESIFGTKIS
jgi:hypothetical protein